MIIYLARHAETNYNVLGLSNSDPNVDVHLTSKGIEQAQELAKVLEQSPIDLAFASYLPRTLETARYITSGRNIEIRQDDRLNDLNMGHEGKSVNEYHKALSEEPDIWTAKFNDGESHDELLEKVDSFLQYLREQKASYSNILVVSHYTVLQLLIARIKNIPKQSALDIDIVQGDFVKLEL
ncbi:MAG TPA: histidine phosphatase family protein [Candidatus Saccharimonadales bacterium]|nr:histidine phosphatase family protein [Candidatus Saccharimonadales bacterium]